MATTNIATDSSTDSTTDENDEKYDWHVTAGGMILAKDNFEYVLGHNSLTVTFDGLRDPDSDYNDGDEGEYELRDDHDTQGYFNPDDDSVPDEIATAFRVLAGEL